MKKIVLTMLITLIAITSVFAGAEAAAGLTVVKDNAYLTADVGYTQVIGNTADPNKTLDLYGSIGVVTDFKKARMDVFMGPGFTQKLDDVASLSFAFGVNTTYFQGFDMGVGAVAKLTLAAPKDTISAFAGAKVVKMLSTDFSKPAYNIFFGVNF